MEMLTDKNNTDSVKTVLGNPNDVLALEYMISAADAEPVVVKRTGSSYDASFDDGYSMQSAGGIRELIKSEGIDGACERLRSFMPQKSIDGLIYGRLTHPQEWAEILRYSVLSSSPEEMDGCPSGGEGLGNLFKKAVIKCNSWNDIIMYCKSKRYTYTRLSRLAMQIILGMKGVNNDADPTYIRILGFNERGRQLLSYIKKNELCRLPLITNINKERDTLDKEASAKIDEEVRYSDIYNMVTKRENSEFSDHIHMPLNCNEKGIQ